MRGRVRTAAVLGSAIAALAPLTLSQGAGAAATGINQVHHIVVLMQENRSADHYLGQLNGQGQPAYEAEPNTGNPDPLNPTGPPILPRHDPGLCETSDLRHAWNGMHKEWDNGAMDGFTKTNAKNGSNRPDKNDPSGTRTMNFYDQRDLPFYYALYNKFATGDRYFASLLAGTHPNRLYLQAATSFGHVHNFRIGDSGVDVLPPDGLPGKTIFKLLDDATPKVTWRLYASQVAAGLFFKYVRDHAAGHIFPISQYYADAKAGTLPQVAFVDPIFVDQPLSNPPVIENDEHPPLNVQVGQHFVYKVTKSLLASPEWKSSALFFSYDEAGGFYDHVAPPAAVKPDNIAPIFRPNDKPGDFDRLGFRVPMAVVSPFAKSHFVSHTVYDHTSILKFIETRFGLPNLTERDKAANDMTDLFDFTTPPFATAPTFNEPAVGQC